MNENSLGSIKSKIALGTLCAILVLTIMIAFSDIKKVYSIFHRIDYIYVLKGLCFSFCVYTGRYLKWLIYLRKLNIRVEAKEIAKIFFCGLSMAITPGKVGEVLKSYLLKLKYRVDFSKTASTIVAERLTGMLGAAFLCTVSAYFVAKENIYMKYIILFVALILISVCLSLHNELFKRIIFKSLSYVPYFKNKINLIDNLYQSASKVTDFKLLVLCTLLSALYWLAECMIFKCALSSVDVNLPLSVVIFILTLSSIAGGLSLMPGSMGAIEGGMIGLLAIYGIGYNEAFCITLIHRVLSMWIVVISSNVYLIHFLKVNSLKI